jgi:Fe-S-cluster containining protein
MSTEGMIQVVSGFYDCLQKQESKDQFVRDLAGIWEWARDVYKVEKNPIKRARGIHEQLDEFHKTDKELFSGDDLQPTCRKGCAHCCHLRADATEDEGFLLYEKAEELGVDWEKLEKQSKYGDAIEFIKGLDIKDRRCVFLGDDNQCKIYEDRPLSCRSYYVVSDPKDCDTTRGPIEAAQMLYPFSEFLAASVFSHQSWEGRPRLINESISQSLIKIRKAKNGS